MSRRQSYDTPTPASRRPSAIPSRLLATDTPGSRASSPGLAASPLSHGRKATVKRIARKRSLWSRLAELPTAFLLDLHAEISLIDLSPLGWAPSLRFWRKTARMTAAEERLQQIASSGRSWGPGLGALLSFLLVCIAFINALYLFTRVRRYEMWLRRDPLASPNAKLIEADMFAPQPPYRTQLWHFLKGLVVTSRRDPSRQVTQLSIWTPPDLNLRIFCVYSPIIALLWHFLDTNRAWVYLPVMALCGAQTAWIVRVYEQTVKDRLLLHAEVASEYNERLVRPRLFAYKRDVGTQTSQAEMIFHDDDDGGWPDARGPRHHDPYATSTSRRRTMA